MTQPGQDAPEPAPIEPFPAGQPTIEVMTQAWAGGLGNWVSTFVPRRMTRGALIATLAISALLVSAGVVVLFTPAWLIGVAALVVGCGMAALLTRSPNFSAAKANRRVYLFTAGFIHADTPATATAYRWDQIRAVFQQVTRHHTNGRYTHTTHRYTVVGPGGGRLLLTDFWDQIAALGTTIEQAVTRAHLPAAVEALGRGETVRFGDLSINAEGLISERRGLLPWSDIGQVRVVNGIISVRRAGRWLPWSSRQAGQIPNVFVFLALADVLRNGSD